MTDTILLFALAVLCFGIGLFAVFELIEAQRQSRDEDEAMRKWWADRAAYREANPPALSDSPLVDDVNRALPDEFKDGGDRAA